MTSASSIAKPWSSDAVRQGVSPTAQSTSAIDAARPAHDVVVVVADPRLVAGHRAGRLDAPYQTGGGQRAQHVVDGLVGHLAEVRADGADDRVRVGVRVFVHGVQHGQPRTGHPQRCTAQQLPQVRRRNHLS